MLSLIKSNIRRNFASYLFYYIAIMLNVAVVYVFFSIPMNSSIESFFRGYNKIHQVFKFAAIIVALFSTMFINYSLNYFVNKRVNELALYSLFGVSKSKISFIVILENLVIGFFAVMTGIIMGMFWSKFVMMFLMKFLKISLIVKNNFELKTFIFTITFYLIVLLLSSGLVFFKVYRLSLLSLFKKSSVSEGSIKGSYLLGILSIILLILGYIYGIYGVYHMNFFVKGVGFALVFSIIGTFLFFRNFMTVALDKLIKNKKVAYKKGRIVWIRRITHRMKSSYKLISIIAILIAITLTSIGIITSLNIQTKYIEKILFENDISYISESKEDDKLILDKIEGVKEENIKSNIDYKMKEFKTSDENDYYKIRLISDNSFKNIDVRDNEMIAYFEKNDYFKFDKSLFINDKKVNLKNQIDKTLIDKFLLDKVYIIDDSLYQSYDSNEFLVRGIKFNNVFDNIKAIGDISYELETMKLDYVSIISQISVIFVFKMLVFISIIIGIIFIFSSASILYIKVVSNTISDSDSFKILSEIGFSDKNIKYTIKNYAKTFYYLPLIVGVLHSTVAILMLKMLMVENGMLYTGGVLTSFLIILSVFLLIYYLFYRITLAKSYSKVIKKN